MLIIAATSASFSSITAQYHFLVCNPFHRLFPFQVIAIAQLTYYIFLNFSPPVNKGDRIAQLLLEKIITPAVAVVEVQLHALLIAKDLDKTLRGEGGFGSTGAT